MVTFNSSLSIFVLFFICYATKSSISTESTSIESPSTTQLDKSKIKIVTGDPNDIKRAKENDVSQYDLKEERGLPEYKFKDGSKCLEVKYDDKELWKHDSSKGNEHPISVLFNISKKTILVVFKDTISIHQLADDQWKSIFSGKPELVELNTKTKADGNGFTFLKSGSVGTYTAKDGKFFNLVRADNNQIWKANDVTEYGAKVIVDGIGSSTKLVAIFLVNGNTKGFHKVRNSKIWTEKKLVERKQKSNGNSESGIELDINKKSAGDGFAASKMIERYTYTAIGENGFSKVKHGDKEIWKAENKDGYAKKVIYDGYNHTTMPDLEIYFSDNKKLEYDNKSGTWTKRGDKQPASDAANKTSGGGTQPAASA